MTIQEAILEAIKTEGLRKVELARRLGKTRQMVGKALLDQNTMSTDLATLYLNAMGYEMVIRPRGTRHLEGEIVVDGGENK